MATAKETKVTKLTAASARDMSEADWAKLLAEKRADLLDVQRSLKAGELANPRKVKELRRDIARLLTVGNELTSEEPEAKTQDDKESK